MLLGAILAWAWIALPVLAQQLQPIPPLEARVTDRTGTLSESQRQALEERLAAFERERGTQIVVLMVPTTAPEDDFSYANRVANAWKVGRKDIGDGLLVLVAKNDRRIRIEVAKSLEGAVPDLAARQIIDRQITPAFRNGDFAGGLGAGVDALMARVRGEDLPLPVPAREQAQPGEQLDDLGPFLLLAVPILALVLTGLLGRFLGSLATGAAAGTLTWWWTASVFAAAGAGLLTLFVVGVLGIGAARRGRSTITRHSGGPPIIFGGGGGGWQGGGWGGSSGGGGFSSGGGGDFGGGGASGNW